MIFFQSFLQFLALLKLAHSTKYEVLKNTACDETINQPYMQFLTTGKFSCLSRCDQDLYCTIAVINVAENSCKLFKSSTALCNINRDKSTFYAKKIKNPISVTLSGGRFLNNIFLSWATATASSSSYTRYLLQYSYNNWANVYTDKSVMESSTLDYVFCSDYYINPTININVCLEACILDKHCYGFTFLGIYGCYLKFSNYTACSTQPCTATCYTIPTANNYKSFYTFSQPSEQVTSFRVKVYDALNDAWSSFSNILTL